MYLTSYQFKITKPGQPNDKPIYKASDAFLFVFSQLRCNASKTHQSRFDIFNDFLGQNIRGGQVVQVG